LLSYYQMKLKLIESIINNKEFTALLVSLLTIIIPLWQYLNSKKLEQKQTTLINFHEKILGKLSNRDPNIHIGLVEQVAIIFELRNFSEYYPVIKRILMFSIEDWNNQLNDKPHFKYLIKEANETIDYINKK